MTITGARGAGIGHTGPASVMITGAPAADGSRADLAAADLAAAGLAAAGLARLSILRGVPGAGGCSILNSGRRLGRGSEPLPIGFRQPPQRSLPGSPMT